MASASQSIVTKIYIVFSVFILFALERTWYVFCFTVPDFNDKDSRCLPCAAWSVRPKCAISKRIDYRNGFYWGNLQGNSSKRRHKYPEISTFPQRGMPGSSGGTLPASCFSLLGSKYENKCISVGTYWCSSRASGLFGKASFPASGDTEAHDRCVAPPFSSRNSSILGEAEWKYTSSHWEKRNTLSLSQKTVWQTESKAPRVMFEHFYS